MWADARSDSLSAAEALGVETANELPTEGYFVAGLLSAIPMGFSLLGVVNDSGRDGMGELFLAGSLGFSYAFFRAGHKEAEIPEHLDIGRESRLFRETFVDSMNRRLTQRRRAAATFGALLGAGIGVGSLFLIFEHAYN